MTLHILNQFFSLIIISKNAQIILVCMEYIRFAITKGTRIFLWVLPMQRQGDAKASPSFSAEVNAILLLHLRQKLLGNGKAQSRTTKLDVCR